MKRTEETDLKTLGQEINEKANFQAYVDAFDAALDKLADAINDLAEGISATVTKIYNQYRRTFYEFERHSGYVSAYQRRVNYHIKLSQRNAATPSKRRKHGRQYSVRTKNTQSGRIRTRQQKRV